MPWFVDPGFSLQAIPSDDFHAIFFNIPSGRNSSVAFVRGVFHMMSALKVLEYLVDVTIQTDLNQLKTI